MKRLLIATNNHGKVAELQELLTGLPVVLETPRSLGLDLDVDETGATYAENALLKADAFAALTGLLTLADDSGLEVDALNGQPGIRSARFAPQPNATDADRRAYLLQKLTGQPRPWTARFRCVIALSGAAYLPADAQRTFEGICPGEIIPDERGSGGFGYDPIFLLPEYGVTMAELPMESKNRISHRARALQAVLPHVIRLLAEQ